MKKTLIALMAIASATCANAAISWENLVLTIGNPVSESYDTSGLGLGNSYTLTMSLDVEQCQKYFPDGSSTGSIPATLARFSTVAGGTAEAPTYTHVGINVNYSSSGGKTSASGLYGTISDGRGNRVLTGNVSDLSSIRWEEVTAAALTMTVYSSNNNTGSGQDLIYNGTSVTLFVQTEDGYSSYFGQDSGQRYGTFNHGTLTLDANLITQAYLFNGAATVGEVSALNAHMIPEPATATLSLLALAGLAARRRRR